MGLATITCVFSLLATSTAAVVRPQPDDLSFLRVSASHTQGDKKTAAAKPQGLGKNKCPCVGIENLRGYFAATLGFHHVQYPLEAGASCSTWEKNIHPECSGEPMPNWCRESWCYVDPCNCDLDVVPKRTSLGTTYQGSPAYFSYDTCSGFDFWTGEKNPQACVLQKDATACSQAPDCAWDGTQCRGKEAVQVCANTQALPVAYGQQDCRCVGFGGRLNGQAVRYINDNEEVAYNANVGSTCAAWEMEAHPDCKKPGAKPDWCSGKWCFVDPCKCDVHTGVPPKAVMMANAYERFQGKTAYFSYETCGGTDLWSAENTMKGEYCHVYTTEASCHTVKKCRWTGEKCLGEALAETCAEQKDTGILGVDTAFDRDGACSFGPIAGLMIVLGLLVVG